MKNSKQGTETSKTAIVKGSTGKTATEQIEHLDISSLSTAEQKLVNEVLTDVEHVNYLHGKFKKQAMLYMKNVGLYCDKVYNKANTFANVYKELKSTFITNKGKKVTLDLCKPRNFMEFLYAKELLPFGYDAIMKGRFIATNFEFLENLDTGIIKEFNLTDKNKARKMINVLKEGGTVEDYRNQIEAEQEARKSIEQRISIEIGDAQDRDKGDIRISFYSSVWKSKDAVEKYIINVLLKKHGLQSLDKNLMTKLIDQHEAVEAEIVS